MWHDVFEYSISLILESLQQITELALAALEFVVQIAQLTFGTLADVFEQGILKLARCAALQSHA